MRHVTFAAIALTVLVAGSSLALDPGQATGTVTVDASTAKLVFAASYQAENLFDESKKDTIVVLTDRALPDVAASNDWELAARASRGELVVLTVRLDGRELVNVGINHKSFDGTIKLPGQWFSYKPGKSGIAGSLTLARREAEGHAWACAVEFAATPPARVKEAEPEPAREAEPTPTLPPATTSNLNPKALVPLLLKAIMDKDEEQAVTLVKAGADPNGRDDYGVPMLNWAVMMCAPRTVKALVDAKASLTYERAPGLSILQEAGACPEAAKILRAAGAK